MVIEDNSLIKVTEEDLSLGTVSIPEGVEVIAAHSFYSVRHTLTRVIFPKSVREIEWNAFTSCHLLNKVQLNEGLLEIGRYAFSDCHRLKGIKIPRSCRRIYEGAFYGCYNIKKVIIPPNTTLGYNAFRRSTEIIYERKGIF